MPKHNNVYDKLYKTKQLYPKGIWGDIWFYQLIVIPVCFMMAMFYPIIVRLFNLPEFLLGDINLFSADRENFFNRPSIRPLIYMYLMIIFLLVVNFFLFLYLKFKTLLPAHKDKNNY